MSTKIITRKDVNFGQPTLEEGYTVLQVVQMVIYGDYTEAEAAERLGIPEESIQKAIEYYGDNEGEIEALREEQQEVIGEFQYEDSL